MLLKDKIEKLPSTFTIGFLLGFPLTVLSIGLIAFSVSGNENNVPEKPMTDPVFDRPSYTANLQAPDDVVFDENTHYTTADSDVTVITPESESSQKENYQADRFTGVYAGENEEPISVPEEHSDYDENENSQNIDIIERVGNDISDEIWNNDDTTTYNSFTQADDVAGVDGCLGSISISSIDLTAKVYQSAFDEMEAMSNGIAHFNSTSSWDGNVGLCGHNWTPSGNGAYFKNLNKVKRGDRITYSTSLGTRTYQVTTVTTIDENDWSYLARTDDNRITLITCTFNDNSKRLCVQGVAV